MLACLSMEQWAETSASVPTTTPKWVRFDASVCGTVPRWGSSSGVVGLLSKFASLLPLCRSGVGLDGVRLSGRHGCTPTPDWTGSVCRLVRRSGWIGCVVSDVIRPTRRLCKRKGGVRIVRSAIETLHQAVDHFIVSYKEQVQVCLVLHVCEHEGLARNKLGNDYCQWKPLKMICRTIRMTSPSTHPLGCTLLPFILRSYYSSNSSALSLHPSSSVEGHDVNTELIVKLHCCPIFN